jgi:hypothetical protein
MVRLEAMHITSTTIDRPLEFSQNLSSQWLERVAGMGLWIVGNIAYYVQCWFANGDIKKWKERREQEATETLTTRQYKARVEAV